jgi:hypothetical protein
MCISPLGDLLAGGPHEENSCRHHILTGWNGIAGVKDMPGDRGDVMVYYDE